jgi:hypothetical protein
MTSSLTDSSRKLTLTDTNAGAIDIHDGAPTPGAVVHVIVDAVGYLPAQWSSI